MESVNPALHDFKDFTPFYDLTIDEIVEEDNAEELLTERLTDLENKLVESRNKEKEHNEWKVDITRRGREMKNGNVVVVKIDAGPAEGETSAAGGEKKGDGARQGVSDNDGY
jgi:DNA primase large subunit